MTINVSVAMLVALSAGGTSYGNSRRQIVCAGLLALQDSRLGESSVVPSIGTLIPAGSVDVTTAYVYDTENNRGTAILGFNDFSLNRGADAVMAHGSSNCATLSLLGAVYRVPLMSFWCSSPVLSNTNEYPFFARTYGSDAVTTVALAQVVKGFGWSNVAMLYRGDEDYTVAYATGLRLSLATEGIRLVAEAQILERDPTSFRPALVTVREGGANIILAVVTDLQRGVLFEEAYNVSMLEHPYVWIT